MKKTSIKKAKKRVVRKHSAKVVATQKEKGIPVDFSVFKSRGSVRARAYDMRDGRQVFLRDVRYVPQFVRRELTDKQIAKFLLTKDAKQ